MTRFLLLSSALLLAGCRNYPAQFELMCSTAREVESELGSVADGATRHRVWAERVAPKLSGDAKTVFGAIGGQSLPADKKYEILRQGAAECGVKDYQCEPLRALFVAAEGDGKDAATDAKSP